MDVLQFIRQMQEMYGDELIKPVSELPKPQQALDREMFETAFKDKKADGGRINFDKGGAAKFREFIKDFDGKIYKGFVSDQANKFNIDRSTAADIIEALRSDIRKKLVERNYDVTKSQVEGGKSYADKMKERKDRVAKENVNTPADDEFKKLSEDFFKDSKYKIKTNKNFAKYLNDKGKTAFGGLKFNENAVGRRLSRVGLTSAATTESLVNKNFKELKKIATEIGVSNVDNIKDEKKLLTKIYERRASEIKKFRRATDPEFQAAEKKVRDKYVKANPEKVKKASQNARLKNAEKFGFPPPAFSEAEELWRSLFVDGRKYKEGRRLKIIGLEKYGAFVPRDEFLNAKILDTKTNKIITFGKDGKNLKNYINKNTPYKYEKVLQPYAQKWFINNTKGLRTEINSKLIKNYEPGSVDNFFEIQHNAGRYNDPFDVSLTNQNVNLKESTARRRFDKAWSMSKSLSDKKKAFQSYTNTLPKEVLSKPGMVKRARYFGEEIPFEQQLRDLKQKGVNLPRGTLKKASALVADLEKSEQIKFANIGCPGKASGGRIGFNQGKNLIACATKGVEKLKGDPGKLTPGDQSNLRAITKSAKALKFLKGALGPAAILGEVLFEGGTATNKFMEGMPIKQALGQSYLNYALGPRLKINLEEEKKKELLQREMPDGKKIMLEDTPFNIVRGEEFAAAERGRRKAPFMAQSKQADKQRLKKRMEQMEQAFPTMSISDIDTNLQNLGVSQQETGMTYPELQEYVKRQDQMQAIADAGGVANLAIGGRAGLSGGDTSGPPPEKGPMSQGLLSLYKNGRKL